MSEKICIHSFISGRVQGVWFRASTKQEADRLGITGWVRNIADGRVEVMAVGNLEQIKIFYVWLQQGPRLANVIEATYEELPLEEFDEFIIT